MRKLFVPVARGPAGIGCNSPMVPFGMVVFPMVGIRGRVGVGAIRGLRPVAVVTKGVRPDIGVKGESPAVDMEIGVNMVRFVPGIMDMLGTVAMPRSQTTKQTDSIGTKVPANIHKVRIIKNKYHKASYSWLRWVY